MHAWIEHWIFKSSYHLGFFFPISHLPVNSFGRGKQMNCEVEKFVDNKVWDQQWFCPKF